MLKVAPPSIVVTDEAPGQGRVLVVLPALGVQNERGGDAQGLARR